MKRWGEVKFIWLRQRKAMHVRNIIVVARHGSWAHPWTLLWAQNPAHLIHLPPQPHFKF